MSFWFPFKQTKKGTLKQNHAHVPFTVAPGLGRHAATEPGQHGAGVDEDAVPWPGVDDGFGGQKSGGLDRTQVELAVPSLTPQLLNWVCSLGVRGTP